MASGTFWTRQRPKTREGIVQVAARDVLLATIGWLTGASVLWAFSTRSTADPVALGVATLFAAIAVPLGILAVVRRGVSWLRRDHEESTSIAAFIVLYSAGQGVLWALWPYVNGWNAMQLWSAGYLWLLVVILAEAGIRLIRPTGWTGILTGQRRIVPVVLLAGVVAIFLLTWVVADGIVKGAREPCDPRRFYCMDASSQALEAALGPAWFGGWSAVTVAAFAVRLRFLAVAALAMAAFGYGFWAQQVSKEIDSGAIVIGEPLALVAAQFVGVFALLGAAAVIQVYEQRERTAAELRVFRWFGANRSTSGDLPS